MTTQTFEILVEIPREGVRQLSPMGELKFGRVFMNARILEISGDDWFEPPSGEISEDEYQELIREFRRKGFTVKEMQMR
jgi:hypothetical protein